MPCLQTINTCGPCKSVDYLGQIGDSNSPCFPTTTSSAHKACLSSIQCLHWQECINSTCQFPLQQCPNNCSGHGICAYEDVNSGALVSECRVGDRKCLSKCICSSDFIGSDSCALTRTEIIARQALRSQLIDNVFFQISKEYPTKQAANTWMASIVAASQISYELDNSSTKQVFNTSNYILSQAATLQLSSDEVSAVLPAVDFVASAPVRVAATPLLSTLQLFSNTIASATVPGEVAFTSVFPNFNLAIFNLPSTRMEQIHLSLPQASLNSDGNSVPSSSIYVPNLNQSNAGAFKVSMISLNSEFYASGSSFYSNPLSITHSNLPCEFASCNILVHLQNSLQPRSSVAVFSNESTTVNCKKDFYFNSNYTCRTGYVLNTSCNGVMSGTVFHRCPSYHSTALCASLDSSGTLEKQSRCELVNVTAIATICSCQLNLMAESKNGRLLGEDISSGSNSTSVSLSVTSVISSIAGTAEKTVLSVQDLNLISSSTLRIHDLLTLPVY